MDVPLPTRRVVVLLAAVSCALVPRPAAAADDAGKHRARDVYERGARHYDLGEYAAAIPLFEEAYALSGAPGLLFNLAQAWRLRGPDHCGKALALYQSYLDKEPAAANRAEIEERLTEMRACVANRTDPRTGSAAATAHAPPPTRTPEPGAPPDPARSRAGLWVAAAGAAAAASGGVLYGRAARKYDQVKATCPCKGGSFDGWQAATTVSYGLVGAGAAAIAGGLLWWAKGRRPAADEPRREALLLLSPTGLVLAGRF